MKIHDFERELHTVITKEKKLAKKSSRFSIARLLSFLMILFAAALGYDQQQGVWYGFAFCVFIAFLLLLKQHHKLLQKQNYLCSRKEILTKQIARFSDDWYAFKETGKDYLTEQTTQAKDLDLLGKNSLYQYLCAAHTTYGKKKLAQALLEPSLDPQNILRRQEAVAELAHQKDFSLHLQATSNLLSQLSPKKQLTDIESFLGQVETTTPLFSKNLPLLAFGLPLVTLCSIFFAGAGLLAPGFVIMLIFVQLTLSLLRYGKTTASLMPLFTFYQKLQAYQRLFQALQTTHFSCVYLNELQNSLNQKQGADRAIRRLYQIGECVNMRFNIIFYLFSSGFLLWDYHCIIAFSKWRKTYGDQIRNWFETLGEVEALLSLSVLCLSKENYTFPFIAAGSTPKFSADTLFHALIQEKKAVANSFTTAAATCIITGANMSGKTTFLRSIGINATLAYAGAPVCAKRFEISCLPIFTSMRIEDDISKGISTFYAELLRIKAMVEFSQQGLPMLVLIDEIFKGTNSADRIIGATETIKKLTKPYCITFVSTHDFELCNLAKEQKMPISNYHFAEFYTNDEIHFDYKIKSGRCQTTNAKHLLRLAGILTD